MIKYHNLGNNVVIAELTDNSYIIARTEDALELMGNAGVNDCNKIIINEKNLHEDFFNLRTGFAGEILQKFSNYRVKLAIIGNFSKYTSKSVQDFIRESNRGKSVFFTSDMESALKQLASA